MNLSELSIRELQKLFQKNQLSSRELVQSLIQEIREDEKHEKPLNALITCFEEQALEWASQSDEKREKYKKNVKNIENIENVLPLLGIPILLKDNMHIKGYSTTCGSKILSSYKAPFDAEVTNRLRNAGAIFLGKTNMDEFAMGSSSEHSFRGAVRNPWNRDCTAGGSSGGSAVSVARGFSPSALGSDTGGSIRQPAAFCGVLGLKPSYGRVSRYGLVAYSSSLDQIGPLTREVWDMALLMNCISGYDPKDSTSYPADVPNYLESLNQELHSRTIGIPKEYSLAGLDQRIQKAIEEAIQTLEKLGCKIQEISLPRTDYGISAYYLLATAEASSNLSRFDGIHYGYRAGQNKKDQNEKEMSLEDAYVQSRSQGFGMEVKRRIILGTYVLSKGYYEAYYVKAQKLRTLIQEDFHRAFQEVDLILTPTTPTLPFRLGERLADPLTMYLSDVFTVNVNLAGLPALSFPWMEKGIEKRIKTAKKLKQSQSSAFPIGIQLIAPYLQEERLLNLAEYLEKQRR